MSLQRMFNMHSPFRAMLPAWMFCLVQLAELKRLEVGATSCGRPPGGL